MKKYDKLVRDKIPEIMADNGKKAIFRVASKDEYLTYLEKKLDEEVAEFHESKSIEELVDILAVIDAIRPALHIAAEDFRDAVMKKRIQRGLFEQRIILIESEE